MIRPLLVAAAVVVPTLALAEPASFEFSDGLIERAVHESEQKLERVGFERDQLEERRSFLKALRALPASDRTDAWRRFRDEQKEREKRFLEKLEQRTGRFLEKGDARRDATTKRGTRET